MQRIAMNCEGVLAHVQSECKPRKLRGTAEQRVPAYTAIATNERHRKQMSQKSIKQPRREHSLSKNAGEGMAAAAILCRRSEVLCEVQTRAFQCKIMEEKYESNLR